MTFAFVGAAAIAMAFTIAAGVRRLLGMRVGALRMTLATLIGLGTANILGGLVVTPMNRGVLGTVMVGMSVLVTMVFLVLAEIVMPNRSRPVEWTRGAYRRIGRTRRYLQIIAILMRHGLTPFFGGAHRRGLPGQGRTRLARSVRCALEEGGVTFVKLGQLLSTRPDVLPEEFTSELSQLQCHVPPCSWEHVRRVLTDELGPLADDAFVELDAVPLAAGSIAQVHRARLRNGTEVVVKIQRPGIRGVLKRDLDIIARLAGVLESRTAWGRGIGVVALADAFADALSAELDFRLEARNMAVIAAGLGTGDTVPRVPSVIEQLCTERVLVMERLDGVPLGSAGPLIEERGLDRDELAGQLLASVLRQVLFNGVFHCDLHPGNIFLTDDDRLALLDFGVVGRLDAQVRSSLQSLLLAMKRDDRAALCDALLDIVVRTEDIDGLELERALGEFMARHLAVGSSPDLQMFAGLFELVVRYGLTVPPPVAAVFRTLATLQGTLAQLAPGFDIIGRSQEYVTANTVARLRPMSLRETVEDELGDLAPLLRRLPRRVDRITAALEQGRLGLSVRLFAHERDRRHLTGLVHQFLVTMLGAATGIMAVMLLGTSGGPQVTETLSLLHVFGYNLLVVSAALGLRVLSRVFRGETQ